MTPEQEVIADLLTAARALVASATETRALIDAMPGDDASFAAMTSLQRMATTALLKEFEQLQDTLNGLFRAILRALGVRLKGLYALDIGNRMAELGILDDPKAWVAIVKLRNELVHEYPIGSGDRYDRFGQAHAAFPFLFDAAERAERVIRKRALLDEQP